MDTATKTTQSGRGTDRVMEALSTLGALLERTTNEVKALDADFQNRLLQAVYETETSLQGQASQHLEAALNDTRAKLEEQFSKRVAELSSQWEEERNRLNAELGNMTQTTAQWETERARLTSELGKMTATAAQRETERARLTSELEKMTATAAQWETERARLTSELGRLAKLQAATQAEAENAIMAMRAVTASKAKQPTLNNQALNAEMERVQGLVKTISDLIEDPAIELSTVIRKNVERAELEAYLKGIRFALNGGESK